MGEMGSALSTIGESVSDAAQTAVNATGDALDWSADAMKEGAHEFMTGVAGNDDIVVHEPLPESAEVNSVPEEVDWSKTLMRAAGRYAKYQAASALGAGGKTAFDIMKKKNEENRGV